MAESTPTSYNGDYCSEYGYIADFEITCEIDLILGRLIDQYGIPLYLIKWRDWGDIANTWEFGCDLREIHQRKFEQALDRFNFQINRYHESANFLARNGRPTCAVYKPVTYRNENLAHPIACSHTPYRPSNYYDCPSRAQRIRENPDALFSLPEVVLRYETVETTEIPDVTELDKLVHSDTQTCDL